MSGNFVENPVKWLRKKVQNKVSKVKMRLKKKYSFLLEEKKKLDKLWRKKKEQVNKDNQKGEKTRFKMRQESSMQQQQSGA